MGGGFRTKPELTKLELTKPETDMGGGFRTKPVVPQAGLRYDR
jgi:hypothetical protein